MKAPMQGLAKSWDQGFYVFVWVTVGLCLGLVFGGFKTYPGTLPTTSVKTVKTPTGGLTKKGFNAMWESSTSPASTGLSAKGMLDMDDEMMLQLSFNMMDSDGDGILTAQEIETFMENMAPHVGQENPFAANPGLA